MSAKKKGDTHTHTERKEKRGEKRYFHCKRSCRGTTPQSVARARTLKFDIWNFSFATPKTVIFLFRDFRDCNFSLSRTASIGSKCKLCIAIFFCWYKYGQFLRRSLHSRRECQFFKDYHILLSAGLKISHLENFAPCLILEGQFIEPPSIFLIC